MSDITIPWKKITRGLPKMWRHADDRAPMIEEIQKICDYPDRRIMHIYSIRFIWSVHRRTRSQLQ